MLKNAIKESSFIAMISKGRGRCLSGLSWIARVYRDSIIHKRTVAFINLLKGYAGSSIFKKDFNIKKNILAINDSLFIDRGTIIYDWLKRNIGRYTVASRIVTVAKIAQRGISSDPARSLGLIILAAAITNTAISLLLKQEPSLLAWFVRFNFIIIGTILVSCKVEFKELKKSSLWFKLIKKRSR